ncbi:hypothetical protein I6N90_02720 [Paenibacillus sp. GSMTC-2017]|uniref:hypothetical protein n=1 Tax=Paenibacillus sp. GSMTC-2017 TaxID=2794350 RepID=UPI0018D93E59|nr:hypothetical protein [Paenibacillus sp. GSMTC-2017]MBH5316722.1 hypothetical protein [Paenibacillus sp. GSMTC-2017]
MRRKIMIIPLIICLLFSVPLILKEMGGVGSGLSYIYDKSTFHDYSIDEAGYIVFTSDITVKNITNNDVRFTMKTDLSKEMGVAKKKFAYAIVDNSLSINVFEIAPNSTQTYEVKFKVLSEGDNTKADKLPPKKVIFTKQ